MEMENFFSRLTLDIIGKAVFNYDFDALTHDDPVIQVLPSTCTICQVQQGCPCDSRCDHGFNMIAVVSNYFMLCLCRFSQDMAGICAGGLHGSERGGV